MPMIVKLRYPGGDGVARFKHVSRDLLDHPPVEPNRYVHEETPWLDWCAGGGYDKVELIEACGIGTGWGPWVCPEPVGHAEHRCVQCGAPGIQLCSYAGSFVCGVPTCAAHRCPVHG